VRVYPFVFIAIDDELQRKADRLFKQSLEQVNYRVLGENKLECIMNNEFAKEEFGKRIEGIPYQVRAEVAVDNGQFKDMIHSMLDDPNQGHEKEVYFYHSDHLGSASWITDAQGDAVQHLQYLPFGEPFVDQRISGYSERFRFTGKELDSETGYGYFGARYMDQELMTSFLSVDRCADKYPNISPYTYCLWNPLKLIDPTGDSAWAILNNWNDYYISLYEKSVAKISRDYRERGEKYTCEDFALSVLIDFASENGLPVTVSNGTGIYDARSAEYSDVASFKNDVLKSTGAPDLQSPRNTLPVDCPQSGDLVINRHDDGQGHHIQLIGGNIDGNLVVYQGSSTFLNSIHGSSRILGASNPSSMFYAGQNIRLAVFNIASDYYVNITTGASYKNYSTTKNIEYRRWNYGSF